MDKIQKELNYFLVGLRNIRMNPFWGKLPDYQKLKYTEALKKLSEFEDFIIINHILK